MPSTRRRPTETAAGSAGAAAVAGGRRTLKKYPNRRLYDTQTSSYITLADVKRMVLAAEEFEVRDAKTGEDLTRSILLQIILEEESGGVPMFSAATLAQIIRFYGHAMQGVMGSFFEANMRGFAELQNRLAEQGKQFAPDAWAQFLTGQTPLVQSMMKPYVDQTRALLERMQEQVSASASLFGGFPGAGKGGGGGT